MHIVHTQHTVYYNYVYAADILIKIIQPPKTADDVILYTVYVSPL